jgi:hypothetical protein
MEQCRDSRRHESKFNNRWLVAIVDWVEACVLVTNLRVRTAIGFHASCRWRAKCGGMRVSHVRRRKQVKDHSSGLGQMVGHTESEHRTSIGAWRRRCDLRSLASCVVPRGAIPAPRALGWRPRMTQPRCGARSGPRRRAPDRPCFRHWRLEFSCGAAPRDSTCSPPRAAGATSRRRLPRWRMRSRLGSSVFHTAEFPA